MKNIYTLYSTFLRLAKKAIVPICLLMLLGLSNQVFAEANYVYHEQTTNNPGCGADNYMSTTAPNSSQALTITWKVEFQFYTDNIRLYYTTDGSTPSGAFGVPSGTTQVITGSYSCLAGTTDIAKATIPAQPAGTIVKYIVSAWHSGGGDEIFANGPGAPCACGTPTNNSGLATVFTYSVTASAAVVEVYASAATAYASYTTLKGAFDAINLGTHQGAIQIAINSGTTETATAALNASGGAVSYTSVKIFPTTIATVTGSIVGAIIKLNGADNVTIDGRIGGSGRNLTVSNTNTSTATAAIWLSSVGVGAGATNNTIRNLEISCGVTQNTSTSTTMGILMSGTTISVTSNGDDNDNNTFTENRIIKCRYGIVTRGVTTNNNQNITVTNNIIGPTTFGIDEIGKAGIFMQADNIATVSGNTVQFVGGTFANTTSGADRIGIGIGTESWSMAPVTLTSGNYTVTNNLIHDIIDERTFSAVGIALATTGGGSATNNIVANNMIYNVKANGTAGDHCVGIGIAGGHTDKVVYNTIYMSGDVDPNPSATATSMFGSGIRVANVNGTTHLNLTLKNNIVYMDLSSSSTPLARYYAISGNINTYSFGTGGENYNAYYINPSNTQLMTGGLGSTSGVNLTTQFATLANWQTAYTVAQDANSINAQPTFTSSTDLHLQSVGGNIPFNDTGTPITGVTTDYDGETRSVTTPDMGADEFSIPVCAGAAGGTITPSTATTCAGLTYNMSSVGATSGLGITYQWEISSTGGGVGFANVTGGTGANTTSYTTDALTVGTYYYRLNVTCSTGPVTGYSNELTLTVNPTPTASASSNSPVCEGTAINLSGTTDIGTSFSWTGPAGYVSASEDPTIPSALLTNAGTYNFIASTGGCSSVPAPTMVVVNPNPTGVTATATPTNLCEGNPITLTSTFSPLGYTMNPAGAESFIDISGTGTSVGVLSDDSEHNITIPSFNYNGTVYTTMRVGNNGAMAFGSTTGEISFTNVPLPTTTNTAGNILLLPYWDDLDIQMGAVVYTETVGSLYIIQYNSMAHDAFTTGAITFEVQLDLVSGAIHFVYSDVVFGSATYDNGINATVGIQFSSSNAIQYSHLTASLTNGQCISFIPNAPSFSWSGPDAFSAATQNTSVPSATLASSGIYTVIATNTTTGCSTQASTATVTVSANVTYYADADGDSYGDPAMSQLSCTGAPVGYVLDNTDCNDANASVNPGATEVCNFIDDDCDGFVDEGITYLIYYNDADGDGYGAGTPGSYCTDPGVGFSLTGDDCNDLAFGINPGATEVCNGIDDDCDGSTDEGVLSTFYADTDGDSYGDAASTTEACSAPVGYVSDNTDCNDANASVNPGATEVCNGIDDDCDGSTDEGLPLNTYYADTDGDGYGNNASSISVCDGSAPVGYTTDNTDCNDGNAAVNPGATEVCNGIDDDCDGFTDEDLITATITPGGPTTFCQGDNVVFTANAGGGYTYQWKRNGQPIPGATAMSLNTNKSGSYVVRVTIPGGCFDESDATVVTVLAKPNATITNQDATNDLCFDASIKLKSSGGAGVTWQWYKGAVLLAGETNVVYFATTPGNYKVLVTVTATGCSKLSAPYTIIQTCKEGEVVFTEPVFTIYPNPTESEFTVDGMMPSDETEAIIEIFNIMGEVIYTERAALNNGVVNERISLNDTSPGGLYIVKLTAGSTELTQQLIIQK